jgi:hypothetical protein
MDRVGWLAIPFDGQLLVSQQYALAAAKQHKTRKQTYSL